VLSFFLPPLVGPFAAVLTGEGFSQLFRDQLEPLYIKLNGLENSMDDVRQVVEDVNVSQAQEIASVEKKIADVQLNGRRHSNARPPMPELKASEAPVDQAKQLYRDVERLQSALKEKIAAVESRLAGIVDVVWVLLSCTWQSF